MQRRSALRGIVALLASIGLLAALGVGPVSAEVLEDQVQEQYDNIACIQPDRFSEDCFNGLAQTFTVGRAGQLTAVEIPIARSAATGQGEELVVELRQTGPTGTLIAASTPVPAADIPVEGDPGEDWVMFDFPDMPSVNIGDVIAIVIPMGSETGATEPEWWWGYQDGDVYATGVSYVGELPDTWSVDEPADHAFATYVAVGEPTCQVVAYLGEDELPASFEVTVGESFDFLFWDFPPFGPLEITETIAGESTPYDDFADAFGWWGWWTWLAEASEVGDVAVTVAVPDSECAATLAFTVVAAPSPSPSPSPAPTPTPTAAPTGTTGGITLPPTTTAGETPSGGASVLPALLVLGATVGILVVASRRFSPTLLGRR